MLCNVSHQHLSDQFSELVENTLSDLVNSKCIAIGSNSSSCRVFGREPVGALAGCPSTPLF
ncbi:hypothetical protein Hypma_009859, partial [Hypsizygus marmoreus]